MNLHETELLLDLSRSSCHSLQSLSVLFLARYLDHRGPLTTTTPSSPLLDTPGCRSGNVRVSGVANTCRHLLLLVDPTHPLLGHHAGCLSGIREVSPWTRYVEVELPCGLSTATSPADVGRCLARVEETLKTPFVGHNKRKIRQEAVNLGLLPPHGVLSHDDWQALPLIRPYLHGLHLGATDVLVFGMVLAKLRSLGSELTEVLGSEMLTAWLERVGGQCGRFTDSYYSFLDSSCNLGWDSCGPCSCRVEQIPIGPPVISCDVTAAITKLREKYEYRPLPEITVHWDTLSDLLKPQRGKKNNTHKMDQLSSLLRGVAGCVETLERRGDGRRLRIVDFCSGGGHLGIFLAYHFPQCEVCLVETKWGSLRYAKERIDQLKLGNVTLCLCHMGQFVGHFDIGVSLHACGSATDAVLSQCVRVGAAVVSSPCCYGKIVTSDHVTYPRSELFRGCVGGPEYFAISRQADHMSEAEGAMKCVDIDRIEFLRDQGFSKVSISKLTPLSCSPKNNIIVAIK